MRGLVEYLPAKEKNYTSSPKQRVEKLLAVVRNEKFKVDSSGHEDESSLVGSMKVRLLFRRRTKCILLDPSKLLFILTIATYNEYDIIIWDSVLL